MLAINIRREHSINESYNHHHYYYHYHHSETISELEKHSLWNFPNPPDLLIAEHKTNLPPC